MDTPEHEARHIREYVAIQAQEEVVSAEKVKTEGVFGTQYDVWDVRTICPKRHWWSRQRTNRWWVITNMTNLYPFDSYPSVDYLLSFHIGLMHRVIERHRKVPHEEHPPKFRESWRRFGQAVDRFNLAKEAEDFQAVGNDLRECLLAFARDHADADLVPPGEAEPQLGNFTEWMRLLSLAIAQGGARDYLKRLSRITWDLTQKLVHNRDASRFDAEHALDATSHFLHAIGLASIAYERGEPKRCPECRSYRIDSDYRIDEDRSYIVCAACGWEALDAEANNRRRPTAEELEEYLNRPVEGPCTFPPDRRKAQGW